MIADFEQVKVAYARGEMVIMVDDEDRENEGDLVVATEHITSEQIAFMSREARGLVCVTMSPDLAAKVGLSERLLNRSKFVTPFSYSIDLLANHDLSATATSRRDCMRRLIEDNAVSSDFVSPGSVFPLVANQKGVLGRRGQTEGSSDLSRICGLKASGVICEILNPDGTLARGQDLLDFAKRHNLLITSVEEIVKYRQREERGWLRVSSTTEVEFRGIKWQVYCFEDENLGEEHLALVNPKWKERPIVRAHSECITGDLFLSQKCDCGLQLDAALGRIAREGGVLLYLRQEGRGIGLTSKVKAYALQDQGLDTIAANIHLGLESDARNHRLGALMLRILDIKAATLLTNNPEKVDAFTKEGIDVLRESIALEANSHSRAYLQIKKDILGHYL